ncbi:CDP-glucose 4,6-dehydratase [Piscinibacter koreensis]|uniref:CDP-glucose 4,6-dehydratase n=1 Tax=Piscinibacter koreensis TaxID=2742824 RepID=A0A7Y6NRW5_9BURK|nr:CDP-glucose 4,6-dehydratase [Schlegelella koreensis]NUZ08204.1 CDP-glucose 4,6-dehydratase [Schlegelella koreensis]
MNPAFWRDKRVLLTGHTGFKGSWLALWLQAMGAEVQGYALAPPTSPNLFDAANVAAGMNSMLGDIRDLDALQRCVAVFRPEIVIHMAAQALVRPSYADPVATYATNVMGTVHVLETVRRSPGVRALVNVTTDKCYENREWVWGYREDEPMGGHDPYSNSKGCAELVTSAYRRSFFGTRDGVAVASARAGNVIGGGDWAVDRLVPDILRAFERKEPVRIRNPHATRPWQHVLEPLSGYLTLAERLCTNGQAVAEGWNFGPADSDARPVQWIVERLVAAWGEGASWEVDPGEHPHEAHYLKLDISKAAQRLHWQPAWNLDTALQRVAEWHRAWLAGADVAAVCRAQIHQYVLASRDTS